MTATGSVGEINAPKTRPTSSGIGMPIAVKAAQVSTPTTAVETTTPSVDSAPIVHLCCHRPSRST
jgi:hypothetical protein